jgi:hypothetical protein
MPVMSRPLTATTRHAGEARTRGRILQHQLDELQRDLLAIAGGDHAEPQRWIRALREQLAILETDLQRWRAEQGVEAGGQGPLRR